MPRPQITIAKLILVVLVAAIVSAALRGASSIWSGAMFSVTFFALLCSLLGIGFGRGLRRIYWSGFALLGWGYLLVSFVPAWGSEATVGEFFLAPNVGEYLDTVLQTPRDIEPQFSPGTPVVPSTPPLPPSAPSDEVPSQGGYVSSTLSPGVSPAVIVNPPQFSMPAFGPFPSERVRVGMAMEALLWAFLGGWVARYFASRPDAALAPAVAATVTPVCEIGTPPEPET
jgi:hypothetical protein